MGETEVEKEIAARDKCRCRFEWNCEPHADQPMGHDGCSGPRVQCPNPECPWWRGPKPAALEMEWDGTRSTRVAKADGVNFRHEAWLGEEDHSYRRRDGDRFRIHVLPTRFLTRIAADADENTGPVLRLRTRRTGQVRRRSGVPRGRRPCVLAALSLERPRGAVGRTGAARDRSGPHGSLGRSRAVPVSASPWMAWAL